MKNFVKNIISILISCIFVVLAIICGIWIHLHLSDTDVSWANIKATTIESELPEGYTDIFTITKKYKLSGSQGSIAIIYDAENDQEYILVWTSRHNFSITPRIKSE